MANQELKPAHEVVIDKIGELSYLLGNIRYKSNFDISTEEGFKDISDRRQEIIEAEASMQTVLEILGKMKIPQDGLMYLFSAIGDLEGRLGDDEVVNAMKEIFETCSKLN